MPPRHHRYDAIRIRVPGIDVLEDRWLREIVTQAFELETSSQLFL
jgi:hypothetical protein